MKIVLAHTLQSAEYFLTDFSAGEEWEEHMEIVTLGPQLFLSTEDQYCSLGRGVGGIGHCMETLLVVILDLFTCDIGGIVPQWSIRQQAQ